MKNIYSKLLDIQKEIKGLSKDKQSHNYGYVTGNKLLSFIKPLMDKHSLILKQEIISIDNDRQDYTVVSKRWEKNEKGENIPILFDKPKSEILSKVMMKFTWIDCETGEKDENTFGANGQNDWEKGLGSALTYAERYFLLKYFHIPTDKDDIDNADRNSTQQVLIAPEPQKTATKPNMVIIPNELLSTITKGLADVKTIEELTEFSKPHSQSINKYPQVKALFTAKKISLNGN